VFAHTPFAIRRGRPIANDRKIAVIQVIIAIFFILEKLYQKSNYICTIIFENSTSMNRIKQNSQWQKK